MKAIVTKFLNVRTGSPQIRPDNNPGTFYRPGDRIEIARAVIGDRYKGNRVWYQLTDGTFIWSGGVDAGGKESLTAALGDPAFDLERAWWLTDYGIDKLWAEGLSGSGVKVAVLDTGVKLPHPDLNIPAKTHCHDVTQSSSGFLDIDDPGHGTHCIGIIKGSDNGKGVKGLAYNCDLYACKVTSDVTGDDMYFLRAGIRWAIDKGVDIISISKTFDEDYLPIAPDLLSAKERNILIVCAGGNQSTHTPKTEIMFPAVYDSVVSVGAVDRGRQVSPITIASPRLELLAPGVAIRSTAANGGYATLSGTSQAAPFVAGVAALLIEVLRREGRAYTVDELAGALIRSGDPVAGLNAGIVNPLRATQRIKSQTA